MTGWRQTELAWAPFATSFPPPRVGYCHLLRRRETAPVILEAEEGLRGPAFTFSDQDGAQSLAISSTVAGGNPTSLRRVVTFTVAFPAPGTDERHVRAGSATFNDDSFYYANGFGAKAVSA